MKIKPADSSEWYTKNGDSTYRLTYNLDSNSIVVDLGARHGDWADLILAKYSPKIYCFDVIEEYCDKLRKRGYETFCKAVIDKKDTIELGITEGEASIFHEDSIFNVESIPASDIFDLIGHDTIDLLKINVEGAEYRILKNLIDTNKIKNIKNIQVQFHLLESIADDQYSVISALLNKSHRLTWRFPFVWENWEVIQK